MLWRRRQVLAGMGSIFGLVSQLIPLPGWAQSSVLRSQVQNTTRASREQLNRALRGRLDVPGRVIGGIAPLVVAADGKLMVGRGGDAIIRAYRIDLGVEIAAWKATGIQARHLSALAQGMGLLELASDGTLRIHSAQGQPFPGTEDAISGVVAAEAAPASLRLALAYADGRIEIRDLRSGSGSVLPHDGVRQPGRLLWTAGERLLVALDGTGQPVAWGLERMTRVASGDPMGPWFAAVATASGEILVATQSAGLVAWDPSTATSRRVIADLGQGLEAIAVEPNGPRLALKRIGGPVEIIGIGDGRRIATVEHSENVQVVSVHPRGRLVTGSEDGVTVYDLLTGRRVLRIIATGTGWLALDESGRYDGTAATLDASGWETAAGRFSLPSFTESHYEPGLLAKIFTPGYRLLAPATEVLETSFAPPPTTKILSGEASGSSEIELKVLAKDEGGGLGEVRLFHDGRAVPDGRVVATARSTENGREVLTLTYRLPANPGPNSFVARALSHQRIEGIPAARVVDLTMRTTSVDLHLLGIGVSKYTNNENLELLYAKSDIIAVSERLNSVSSGLFENVYTKNIFDAEASRERIIHELGMLSEVSLGDIVIIIIAGHGLIIGDDWYFLPGDLPHLDRSQHDLHKLIEKNSLSVKMLHDLIRNVPAQRVLIMVDACQSGGAVDAFGRGVDQKALANVSRSNGIHILAATQRDQDAYEFSVLKHGAFTYTVLQALAGEADPSRGEIWVKAIAEYTQIAAPKLSVQIVQSLMMEEQKRSIHSNTRSADLKMYQEFTPPIPTFYSSGRDFLVGLVSDE